MRYKELCELLYNIEIHSKSLYKTWIISQKIKKVSVSEISDFLVLLQGRIFPLWDERKIGFSENLLLRVINVATGISITEIKKKWKKLGDLGKVVEELIVNKNQTTLFAMSKDLTLKKVVKTLRKLADIEGEGSVDIKIQVIAELLANSTSIEAKYLLRTILDMQRIGVGEGVIRDALVWAFLYDVKYDEKTNEVVIENREEYKEKVNMVQKAFDITTDFGEIAEVLKEKGEKGLKQFSLNPGKPIKVMLALKEEEVPDAFDRVGSPAAIEYKLDGFRLQVHKYEKDGKEKIKLFTRRLENVTKQFPELIRYIKNNVKGKSFILDCEAVGIVNGKYIAFQQISQRIKRKYNIEDMAKKFPMELNVFDVLYYNGENLIQRPFKERTDLVKKIVKDDKGNIRAVRQIITSDQKKADKFYLEALDKGNEGVMFKKLDAPYKPGARVGYMVKMKPLLETLDLVIVGAEWGEGKRSDWITSYVLACKDGDRFLEIGRVSTGFKEKDEEGTSFSMMTKMIKPLITKDKGKIVEVKPSIIIEVSYEEIQKSTKYSSGYALRFPRFVRLRDDRGVDDLSTLKDVERIYHKQRGR